MVIHILDPSNPTLLSRVMKELRTAQGPGGEINVPTLVSSRLLQSVYLEVLRMYMDVLLPREVTEDTTLPMDSNDRRMHFKEGAIMMLPTYISQYAKENWDGPPTNQFCGDRFLKTDAETGSQVLSTAGTGNKLFPYGGGNTMCPGRLFAKQEMIAGAAIVLLAFDIEVLGFVDEKGKPKKDFIGMKQTSPGTGVVHPGGDLRVRMANKLSREIDSLFGRKKGPC
jgi:cytochrome P450